MVPLDLARVGDLGPGNLVRVECACGRTELPTPRMLATAGVGPDQKVLDLGARLAAGRATREGERRCRSGGPAARLDPTRFVLMLSAAGDGAGPPGLGASRGPNLGYLPRVIRCGGGRRWWLPCADLRRLPGRWRC
jgi:hypothetical protein